MPPEPASGWSPTIFGSLIAGVVLIAVSIPLILKKIGPNPIYGFRTSKTLSRPEVWYKANSVAGKDLLIAGLVVIVCDLVLTILPGFCSTRLQAPLAPVYILLLAVTFAVAHSFWALSKM
ncbi:MAG: SdpI family protein [Candidatus Binataceae bacterium]